MNVSDVTTLSSEVLEFVLSSPPIFTVGTLVIGFFTFWMLSKPIVGKYGILKNAGIFFLYQIMAAVVLSMVFSVLTTFFPPHGGLLALGFFAALVGFLLYIPMHVYQIGILRALTLLVASTLVTGVIAYGTFYVLGAVTTSYSI